MSTEQSMTRRGFLRGAAGTAGVAAASGAATAQGADFGGWLSDTDNFDGSVADRTGQGEVTVQVGAQGNGGAFAFEPAAVRVDPGTTVVWEWTGEGGQHNVHAMEGGDFESDLAAEAGFTFEHTFESEGTVTYQCDPHASLGMKGVVVVGGSGGGGGGNQTADGGGGGTGGGGGQPDFGGWLEGVDGGFADARGQGEVTVTVGAQGNGGAFAFEPAGLWVDPGTTVVWEWTGEGGQHNVHAQEGADFESDLLAESGATFEHTFESDGIVTYQCDPHASLGMKGAVAVGEVETTGGGGNGGGEAVGPSVPDIAKTVGVATSIAMLATLGLAFFLMKYGGDRTPE